MGIFIHFGEWLPDLPPLGNPGATVAKNVLPDIKSYLPFPNSVVYSTSLGSQCKGAIVARDITQGVFYNYAGDASALYQLTQLSWSNVSRLAGGAYSVSTEEYWEFAQFGTRVIAVNGNNSAQAITVGAANFADLGGGAPQAKHIATVRDFVVMGNLSATATSPQMVRWCAINNVNSWTPDAATMADFQDLPGDGGPIQKIIGGEYGTVFQERAIYRMTFVGAPLIFQFDRIQINIGALAPQSVVGYRNFTFFLAEEGFQMFDGTNIVPIGAGKVDFFFLNDVDVSFMYRVHGVIDPTRKIVAWAYPASGHVGGNPNKIIIYNWAFKRWSLIEDQNLELLTRIVTGTYTLDSLDSFSTDLDSIVASLDSAQWRTGNYLLAQFNSSHRIATHNGTAMAAVVETGETTFNSNPDGVAYVTEVRPIVEGYSTSVTVAVTARIKLSESANYTSAITPNSAGIAECRSTGRYHRFRVSTINNSDFTDLIGVDITHTEDGMR